MRAPWKKTFVPFLKLALSEFQVSFINVFKLYQLQTAFKIVLRSPTFLLHLWGSTINLHFTCNVFYRWMVWHVRHQRYQKCLRRSNKWSYRVRNWGVDRGHSAASCKAFLPFVRKVGPTYLYMTCTKVLEHLWIYFCRIQYTKCIYSIQ